MKRGGWTPLTGKWLLRGVGLMMILAGAALIIRTPSGPTAPLLQQVGLGLLGAGMVIAVLR